MSKPSKKQQLLELARNKGVIRSADVVAEGLPREYLSRLAKEGELVRDNKFTTI